MLRRRLPIHGPHVSFRPLADQELDDIEMTAVRSGKQRCCAIRQRAVHSGPVVEDHLYGPKVANRCCLGQRSNSVDVQALNGGTSRQRTLGCRHIAGFDRRDERVLNGVGGVTLKECASRKVCSSRAPCSRAVTSPQSSC